MSLLCVHLFKGFLYFCCFPCYCWLSKRSSVGEMIGFLSDCRLSSVVGETISVRRSVVTSPAAQEACFNNSPRGVSQHLKSEKNVTSLWSGRDLGGLPYQRCNDELSEEGNIFQSADQKLNSGILLISEIKKYQTFSVVEESFFCALSWSYQRCDWWTSKVMHQLRVPIWP